MILVLVRRVGIALVAGVALAACASGTDSALADAQQACTDMGFEDGKSVESDGSSVGKQSADEWAEDAADYDEIADQVARAAREDRRWDRLSNAVTDFQGAIEQMVTVADESLPQADRDAAQAAIDRLDVQQIGRVVNQECRKIQAQ
ncbi:hypothetical protein [Streptomyces turgidiscabies]|uniref:hypothetical protein n=1 Tax=Streptomyces turgidiscabies TaxID=85558 RepID=UPI0038F5E485